MCVFFVFPYFDFITVVVRLTTNINHFRLDFNVYMGCDLNIICIGFFSLFGLDVLASFFYFYLGYFFFLHSLIVKPGKKFIFSEKWKK